LTKVSIIIPFKNFNDYLEECIENCLSLDYEDYEILLLPDGPIELSNPRIKVIPTGDIGPSDKRDVGIKNSTGEICAFIDDDTFPREDWLKNAIKYFDDGDIAAVGGPAVTPDNDGVMEKAGGSVFASFLGGGKFTYRYTPKKSRYVDDYPSCNLLVRKSILDEIGGFDSDYYPGEDTKLCLNITKLGKKILYAPDILIYHHRRPLFVSHLKQTWNYGVHRGFFVKRFPETSRRLTYFLPSIALFSFLVGLALSIFNEVFRYIFTAFVIAYLFLGAFSALINTKSLKMALLVPLGILMTHLCYGLGFVAGLTKKELER
jgi:GT2 family glycosyltransferase